MYIETLAVRDSLGLGCRNSVMRDLFVADLVARSSVDKGSVVKESLIEQL